ncbi:MAG: hypothetical protein CYG61_10220 [Actinobacteria bacterium]|nr:MAG: hypothetical protein CYG61_10220 [Actinomycetota bacterium]
MEPTETPPPHAPRTRGRLSSGIVAGGAALALTFAGLGVAGAQVSSTTTDPGTSAVSADAPGHHLGSAPHHHGPGRRHHAGGKAGLSVAAGAIGISETDLLSALRSGQSIAQVAESQGVAVKKVVDALVADAKTRLAAKVTAGELTQAQADQRAGTLADRITAQVNRAGSGCGRRGPRPPLGSASVRGPADA